MPSGIAERTLLAKPLLSHAENQISTSAEITSGSTSRTAEISHVSAIPSDPMPAYMVRNMILLLRLAKKRPRSAELRMCRAICNGYVIKRLISAFSSSVGHGQTGGLLPPCEARAEPSEEGCGLGSLEELADMAQVLAMALWPFIAQSRAVAAD